MIGRGDLQNLGYKDEGEMRSARRFWDIMAWTELGHRKQFQQLYIQMFVIIKTLLSSTVGTVKHEGLGKQD